MADDITDIYKAINEVTVDAPTEAQRRKLYVAREELGDVIRHAERAATLITDLLGDGASESESKPEKSKRLPLPGEIWEMSTGEYAMISHASGSYVHPVYNDSLSVIPGKPAIRVTKDVFPYRFLSEAVKVPGRLPEGKLGNYVTGSSPVTNHGPRPGEIWELSNGDYAVICKDPGKALQVTKGTLKPLRPSRYYRLAGDLRAIRLVNDDVRRHRATEERDTLTTKPAIAEIWAFSDGRYGHVISFYPPTAVTVDEHGKTKDGGEHFRFSMSKAARNFPQPSYRIQ